MYVAACRPGRADQHLSATLDNQSDRWLQFCHASTQPPTSAFPDPASAVRLIACACSPDKSSTLQEACQSCMCLLHTDVVLCAGLCRAWHAASGTQSQSQSLALSYAGAGTGMGSAGQSVLTHTGQQPCRASRGCTAARCAPPSQSSALYLRCRKLDQLALHGHCAHLHGQQSQLQPLRLRCLSAGVSSLAMRCWLSVHGWGAGWSTPF